MDIKGLKKALPICFEANVTMLIVGPHGVGKSQGVRQAIEGQDLGKVFDYRLGQMADTGDIIGLLNIDNNKDFCTFKIPERIHEIIQYCENNPDKYGVLFFDEMNRTTKDILQAIFQIVLDHELNGLKFPKNMKAVCAINPATDDYSVLDFDDKAFADRFCHVKFTPSVGDWLEYAKQTNVDPSITAFIGDQNGMLKKDSQGFDLQVEPSPRSWMMLDRIKKLNPDNATFQELAMGIIGIEATSAYQSFCSTFQDSIKGIEILNDFKKYKKQIQKYSNVETDRTDILRNIADEIKEELKQIEKMPKEWETNLSAFFCEIPRDLAMGFLNDFFEVTSFMCTETDEEEGLTGGKSKASQNLIKRFDGWSKDDSTPEVKDEEKSVSPEDDIPF